MIKMSKVLRYFLFSTMALSVLFLASCEEEIEGPVDPASLEITQGGTVVNSVAAAPGEDVTVDVTISYGDEVVDNLIVYEDDGTIFNTYPLTNAPTSVQVTYPVASDASGTLDIVFELSGPDGALTSETLAVEVSFATVVDVALSSTDFETLVLAVTEAGLAADLEGQGPFTVFAPTDDAFADAGITSAADLPATDVLTDILQYHVVPGLALSTDLATGYYETLSGDSLYILVDNGVFVNGVEVTTADLQAQNGVVHVIGEVLIPNTTTYESFLLAAPTGDETSETFFSTSSGELYSFNEVVSTTEPVSGTVDFGYFYGNTLEATLLSPDNGNWTSTVGYDMAQWNTLNTTVFRTTNLSPEAFDAIASSQGDDIEAEFEAGTALGSPGRAPNLTADNVVAFQTEDGRFGLVKVVEVVGTTGSTDGIRIAVKVTQ